MKFDFVIGNPPYNEETADTSDKPVYNFFMEAAYQVGEKVELITPARFLFNAGKTPKDFNRRMLNDEHFKVLDYAPDARKYFKGVDIEGGVAITLRDETKNFGAIGTFTRFEELNSIHKKVVLDNPKFRSINEQIFAQSKWNLETLYKDHPECKTLIGSGGNERRLTTGIFDSVKIFREREQDGDVKILGLIKNRRVFRYVEEKYIDTQHENLYKYKVFVPKANGSGAIGSTESTPLIGKPVLGEPLEGSTQTFIGVGAFDTEARAMLGILKITQDNTADKWAKVPLQDFTSASDIDWSGNVDAQLYKKYGLDASEIEFIERHVKEMI